MVFSVVMYGCENWTIKKVERWRIDAFELWCWRLLRVPWTAWRSNQSILKEISTEYSLERLMLKLKLQYFGHLMQRTDSLEETLMLGKIECRRGRGRLPGSSPGGSRVIRRWGRSRRLWKNTYLITDIERLEMDSVIGRLVEKKRLNNLDYME